MNNCKYCNNLLEKRDDESNTDFNKRQYCNVTCVRSQILKNRAVKHGFRDELSYLRQCTICGKEFSKRIGEKPSRFLVRKTCSTECFKQRFTGANSPNYGKTYPFTPENPRWYRKSNGGMEALHLWVANRYPKKELCELCKSIPPRDLANKSNRYLSELSDWMWLCRRCHMKSDGRLEKFLGSRRRAI